MVHAMSQANRLAIEGALERGHLWMAIGRGPSRAVVNYWLIRRNGKTHLWKRDVDRFNIPIKAGLRETAQITELTVVACITDSNWQDALVLISSENPMRLRDLSRFHLNAKEASRV